MFQRAITQGKKKYNSYTTQAVDSICQLKQQKDEFYETKGKDEQPSFHEETLTRSMNCYGNAFQVIIDHYPSNKKRITKMTQLTIPSP